jgi:hypothetical protein
MGLLSRLSLLAGLVVAANAISTIDVVGNKFFDKDGKQFFMKGVSRRLPRWRRGGLLTSLQELRTS